MLASTASARNDAKFNKGSIILFAFYFLFEQENKQLFIIKIPNFSVWSTFEDLKDLKILERYDDLTSLND